MKFDEMLEWVRRYEQANFIVEKKKQALIRDLLGDDLTPDQLVTMQYIRKKGTCTSTGLAEAFCIGKSSVTAIINRLVEKRYITRMAEASDRRVITLALTEEGKRVHERFERKIHELLASLLECFAPGEVETFLSTYEKLASNIQKIGRRVKEI